MWYELQKYQYISHKKLTIWTLYLFDQHSSNIRAPRLTRMTHNPSELCLIDANVASILQLTLQPSIISLNLHCNLLKKIDGLDVLPNLKYLDLSSNNIERISGLQQLVSLKYLNLSCNQISVVEGLETLQ